MADNGSALTTNGAMINNVYWKIQYARFFNFPITSSSTPTSSFLRPIYAGRKDRLKGTWVPSSSSNVSLHILLFDLSFSEPTLVVSLGESIYEEHYISKLNFTWPQGSDDSGCALRGSRVIFASYRDGMGQIQKFVLRFSSSKESQEFMESLKSVKERRNCSSLSLSVLNEGVNEEHTPLRLPSINQEHDPYSCSEGVDEEHRPLLLPSIIQEHDPYSCSEEAAQDLAVGNTDVALPQSFSALLADCCTETNLGIPQVPAEDLNRFYKEVSFRSLTMSIIQLLDASPSCTLQKRGADKILDMLDMMDSVIIELGGNLAI
ncbi:protein POOR HOMOLOGOUS SYNAPSIS 1-like isoform X1 [Chenopodium quinoa]|uniref:protein POOR HOMOLOGOUS SYNAPSIS 1-like isoform X1 n=1 Tax=Chenopodium quinoa TaxID=63459 RepID=UPI000B76F11C|nr:protein POOR HOMOLOGOUS SYNAPSIS 1-like isoform X1 [Chenopodium quinoa]